MDFVEVILADDFGESLNWVEDFEANVEGSSHFGGEYFGLGDDDVEDIVVLIGV